MKKISLLFSISVLGVAVCLVMTVITGIQSARQKAIPTSRFVPIPAIGQ